MSNEPRVAIGIDLGYSKCCVGVVRDGKVEIIENERGNKTTPSYVAFTDTERLIGEDAKDQATLNPTNTVFGVKRIMGRKGDDPIVKNYAEKVPFVVTTNEQPVINVTYKEGEEFLFPQQISAMLLTKMKEMSETHLGCGVHDAVISVPACFTNAQRQATKDAAQIAGLNVLRLINEPTAAAIAYEANRRTDAPETVVVVDFGGGKLDVSVIDITKRKINVRAVAGVANFGGSDIDAIVKEHLISTLEIVQEKNISEKISEILRFTSEQLKQSLSLIPAAHKTVDCFSHEGDDISLTKDEFKSLIQEQLKTYLKMCLVTVLKSSGCIKETLERVKVILVGGSTRISLVQEFLLNFFDKKQLDQSINPDEAVAYGAALQAALLGGDNTVEDLEVTDVVPFCLDFNSKTYIPHFAPFPQYIDISNSDIHWKDVNDVTIYYIGCGRCVVGKIDLLKEFGRATRIFKRLVFVIDENGIYDVKVFLDPNHCFDSVGGNYSNRLDDEDMDDMIKEEQQFRMDTTREKERVAAMTDLEACCLELKERVESHKTTEKERLLFRYIAQKCSEYLDWLDSTKMAKKCEYEERKEVMVSLEVSVNKIGEQTVKEANRNKRREERQLKEEQRQMKQNEEKSNVSLDSADKIEVPVETDKNKPACMNNKKEEINSDANDADKVKTKVEADKNNETACNSADNKANNNADKNDHGSEIQPDNDDKAYLQPDAAGGDATSSDESIGLMQSQSGGNNIFETDDGLRNSDSGDYCVVNVADTCDENVT